MIELKECDLAKLEVGKMYLIHDGFDYYFAFWEDNDMFDSPDLGFKLPQDVLCAGPIKEIR